MGSIDHKGNVVNFHKATQECVVTDKPLIPGQQPNALFDEYVTWLAAIEEKLLEHVIDNRNIYKKLAGDITEPNRQKAIELLRTRFKSPLHEQGGNQKVSFKAKLYQKRYKQKAERKEFACALDEELAASHNVQRTDIPVFEANGQLVPLEERVLRPDDVVSLQSRLFVLDDSTAVKKSFTLTRHLGSVVILRKGLHDYTKLLEMQRWRKVSALRTGVNKW
ncbi:hypothetical protein SARC_07556 [Sphaeroforma arctica JP610]|uniref:Uncharacterized protein n=1 Tax=Sphaeroforma arctica JP610 TaxID=667725 RepID=A0A0L0FVX5_9EUKA|nr:hypothetical protein SARC_07556 [Sphaeroforma arctica JP610]KNC80068.1 hypothetical protein SARC_07556 [Sphaeroforma arctica JP610]|eukprot:XP_014153970.1 hypothetical protein SARC_07556 [Sphaeroforma arctica JP610]